MPTSKQVIKTSTKIALTTTIAASYVAKYGLSFTTGLAKTLYGGALNMANDFAPVNINFGTGNYLLNSAQDLADKGCDSLIKMQKYVRGRI